MNLSKGYRIELGAAQKEVFEQAKVALSSKDILLLFDQIKPIMLLPDAWKYGNTSCILKHIFPNGQEHMIDVLLAG